MKKDDFLFGIFDFDRNDKSTIDEEYIGYLIFRDIVCNHTDEKNRRCIYLYQKYAFCTRQAHLPPAIT